MTGSILIVDSVATNRIVLKAKLVASQYPVTALATCEEAETVMENHRPDLLLINLSDPIEDSHRFCTDLHASPKFAHLAIIAVGIANTSLARFAALDAGADDVLPRPMSDDLMLARIRGLLRRRSATLDWSMREDTSRALGFQEETISRLSPPKICLLPGNASRTQCITEFLQNKRNGDVTLANVPDVLRMTDASHVPDVFVMDATRQGADFDPARIIPELKSRFSTRNSEILVLVPNARNDIAARVLDLGASDVAFADATEGELRLRVKKLVKQKTHSEHQRENVKSGLDAALVDPLTGLFNRRYSKSFLKKVAENAQSLGQSYALMIFDIDYFKSVNDQFGHAAGDKVLVKFAKRLRANFRAVDLVARIGGEEFMVVMPDTDAKKAEIAAERMRRTINRGAFNLGGDTASIQITISVGVTVDQPAGFNVVSTDELFDRADAALYQAKTSGRDRVAMSKQAA